MSEISTAVENLPQEPEEPKRKKKDANVLKQSPAPTCPACLGTVQAIAHPDAYECITCGTVFQTPTEPMLNGKTFGELYASAKDGEEFVYPDTELRSFRSLEQLDAQKVTSVFSNGGIVAALVRAGFTVLRHTPHVVFSKPTNNSQE
jgi:hypothetical protein